MLLQLSSEELEKGKHQKKGCSTTLEKVTDQGKLEKV